MKETVYYNSPIGILQISSDDNAISAISFADKTGMPQPAEKVTNIEIPKSPILKECVTQLDDYFAGKRFQFNLKLSQHGTKFQQQVWNELLNIGYGKTTSYLTLSKNIGNVKAIRAVGTANGKNHIAVIVPCHRVIGHTGNLVGYAAGLWRKQWLLEHEAIFANGVQKLF